MDVSKRLHVVGSLVMILVCSSMVFAPPKSGSGSEELVSPSGAEAHNMVRAGATLDTGRCFYASRSVMIRHDDIYEKPYWFSKKVGCLSACQGFDIVGKSSDSQWYKLSGGGWVSFVYIYRKPYVPIVATPKHNYNQKFSTAVPFVCTSTTGAGVQATAVPMVLISPTKFPVPPEVASGFWIVQPGDTLIHIASVVCGNTIECLNKIKALNPDAGRMLAPGKKIILK